MKKLNIAILNAIITALITMLSMVATGDMYNTHLWHSAVIAGSLAFLTQVRSVIRNCDDEMIIGALI